MRNIVTEVNDNVTNQRGSHSESVYSRFKDAKLIYFVINDSQTNLKIRLIKNVKYRLRDLNVLMEQLTDTKYVNL